MDELTKLMICLTNGPEVLSISGNNQHLGELL